MADSATILTLWALLDDLWEPVEWLLDKFDPPKFRGRKRAPARLFLDGLIYHFHLMSGHFCFLEKYHSSPRERRLTLAQYFSAG